MKINENCFVIDDSIINASFVHENENGGGRGYS